MCHDNDARAVLPCDIAEQLHHLTAVMAIECSGWFVGQQNTGLIRHRSRIHRASLLRNEVCVMIQFRSAQINLLDSDVDSDCQNAATGDAAQPSFCTGNFLEKRRERLLAENKQDGKD